MIPEAVALARAILEGSAREHDVKRLATLVLEAELDGEDLAPAPVLIDTREQRPFAPHLWIKGQRVLLDASRANLNEGDYTTPAAASHVCIERKSIEDLYGTLFGSGIDAMGESAPNQERFREELLRLRKYAYRALVVEGNEDDLVEYIERNRRRVTPQNAIQTLWSLAINYQIPVVTFSNYYKGRYEPGIAREKAEWFTGYVLSYIHNQATSIKEARKARARGLDLPWLAQETEAAR